MSRILVTDRGGESSANVPRQRPWHRAWHLFAVALAVSGCGRHLPLTPESRAEGARAGGVEAKAQAYVNGSPLHIEGVLGPGALYAIDVPAEWNGDLVLYMHGIKPAFAPVDLPGDFEDFNALLGMLLGEGYAVAHSSYSENGYAVPEAARQTRQLSGVFADAVGEPRRTLLIGQSLGGVVGQLLVEKFPQKYAGAFFVSGVVGGSAFEVDFLATIRVLFDYFYPGVLGGDLFHVPDEPFPQDRVVAAIMSDAGTGLGAMARIKQCRVPVDMPVEHLPEFIITALGAQWIGGEDFFDRTHSHSLFDNRDVVYEALAPGLLPEPLLADLNARVARWSATPDAEAWLSNYYEPTGDLRLPMLALHNHWDPVVPTLHEDIYAEKVAAAGRSEFLLQIREGGFGHRKFEASRIFEAFQHLASWVNSGVKPPA